MTESLRLHNGQSGSPGLFEGEDGSTFRLLTTDEMISEWSVWQELAESGDFDDLTASPSEEVQARWCSEKWLPIAGNGLGDFLCLDYGPAKGGKKGQVITLGHESGERSVCFASFAHLLNEILDQWQQREVS